MSELANKECIPCKGGVPKLEGAQIERLVGQIGTGWRIVDEHHLEKLYKFGNFQQALDFTTRVGALAEAQNHHPDIYPDVAYRCR